MGLIESEQSNVAKLMVDMYFGDGPDCPSMTTRMSAQEKSMSDLQHELHGNGQKGFIEDTKDYISKQKGMWMAVLGIGVIMLALQALNTIRDFMRPIEPPVSVQHSLVPDDYYRH